MAARYNYDPEKYKTEFGKEIVREIKKYNALQKYRESYWTFINLSKAAGLPSDKYLCDILNGRRNLTRKNAFKIVAVLRLDPERSMEILSHTEFNFNVIIRKHGLSANEIFLINEVDYIKHINGILQKLFQVEEDEIDASFRW